ncbi:MAG TPA: hypothetical protein VNO14_16160 [Blastocatellia bacterium]|nr:hypothetical protein [Blastocatellia bacterium]
MNIDPETRRESLKPLLENLDEAALGLDLRKTDEDQDLPHELPIGKLRRGGRRRPPYDRIGMITLTELDGILQWEEGTGVVSMAGRRLRRGISIPAPSGEIVAQYKFEKLPPSEVGRFLEKLDAKLTPTPGLRRLDAEGALKPAKPPGGGSKKRKTLLLVHGTFSNNDHLIEELNSTGAGRDFIGCILEHYDDVFAFDHSTLSVSPVLNALDLARLFAEFKAPIDVICHSRGGLVVRWWLEAFGGAGGATRRVVLVGAPLGGTSLASPPRLRAALGLITNVGRALSLAGGAASLAVPMLSVAVGLVKVVTSIASLGEKAPLIDAAVAMIPGLAGQSRVGNSAELLRLRQRTNSPLPDYYAVCCNFETEDAGWAFWRRFRKMNLADFGTDMVFDGQNDLVVDTRSMTDLFDDMVIPQANILDFGTTGRVHHTNYFQQPETIDFIKKSLAIK